MNARSPTIPNFTWAARISGLSDEETATLCERMRAWLDDWSETPYHPGASARKVGVDCVRYTACFLNDMLGEVREPLERLPQDIAFHQRETAIAAMRLFMRIYAPCVEIEGHEVEPGDIGVMAWRNGGPGHGMIATPRARVFSHAIRPRVCYAPALVEHGCSLRIIRPLHKRKWLDVA